MATLYILVTVFLSTLIGTVLGEIACVFIPANSVFYNLLTTSVTPLWHLEKLDLVVLVLGISLQIKITLTGLLGMVTGAVFSLRKI